MTLLKKKINDDSISKDYLTDICVLSERSSERVWRLFQSFNTGLPPRTVKYRDTSLNNILGSVNRLLVDWLD